MNKTTILSFTLEKPIADRLNNLSKEFHTSRSKLVNMAVKHYISKLETLSDKKQADKEKIETINNTISNN